MLFVICNLVMTLKIHLIKIRVRLSHAKSESKMFVKFDGDSSLSNHHVTVTF